MNLKNKLIYNIWTLSNNYLNFNLNMETNIGTIKYIDNKRNLILENNKINIKNCKIITLKQIINYLIIEKKCDYIINNNLDKTINRNQLKLEIIKNQFKIKKISQYSKIN